MKTGDKWLVTSDQWKEDVTSHQSPVTGHSGRRPVGFTLIELMLVIIIIGVLAAMVVPRLTGRTEQAKIARSKSDIAAIEVALDLYEFDTGKFASSLESLVGREPPADFSGEASQWNGPYLKKGLPKDPWGRTYVYNRDSQHNQDYDIFSLGQDGQLGNDDISNWE